MSDIRAQPLRTFQVLIRISYEQVRAVRARTIKGTMEAARASAEADYSGAEISVGHPEEKRGKEVDRS